MAHVTADSRRIREAPLRGRAGFTFIELIVGLAIMVMIATVVTPTLFAALDKARLDTAMGSFQAFSDAIDAFENDVKEHPGYLHQLTKNIDPTQTNICGNYYKSGTGKGGDATWMGPYLDRVIDGGKVPVGVGIADDKLERIGDKNKSGYLIVHVDNVTLDDAQSLDLLIDAQNGSTLGTIQWDDPVNGYVHLKYVKPSPRC